MAKPKITLYVDAVSPFAYLAFYALRNFPVFQQCEITYVPIFLGGLMKQCGSVAPLQIKNKAKWINIERLRWAKAFDIPVAQTAPDGFPNNTIGVQRALTAINMQSQQKMVDALTAVYQSFWVERNQIQKPEVVIAALAKGMNCSESEAKAMFEKGSTKEVKDQLTKNTGSAFNEGAFGLPYFLATNSKGEREDYWGFDHLGQLMDHLGLERPNNEAFKSVL